MYMFLPLGKSLWIHINNLIFLAFHDEHIDFLLVVGIIPNYEGFCYESCEN
jgi:hypothetical protein